MDTAKPTHTATTDQFLTDLVAGLHGSVVATDRELSVLHFNERWQSFNGLGPEAALGGNLCDLIPGLAQWRGAFERALSGEVIKVDRVRLLAPDGSDASFRASILPWRDRDGAVGGLILNSQSLFVTEAREEADLAASRLEDAVALAGILVWEIDHATRQVTGWGATDTFFEGGLSYERLARDGLASVVHPQDRPRIQALWEQQAAAGEDGHAEFRLDRDDRLVWVASSTRDLGREDGQPGRVLGVLQDITARKSAELAAAEANAAKTSFLATMSHEIRTPLTGVLGMAEAMTFHDLAVPQRARLDVIRQSGQALLDILNDCLDLSKIEAGMLELEDIAFDLEVLLQSALAPFLAVAERKGVALTLTLDDADGAYRGDPTRLRQVVSNLVSNALKFTDAGSVSVMGRWTLEGLQLSVTDTGPGIAPEHLDRLFSAFRQAEVSTARQFGGTGLGLSICRHLVELMGGSVRVESQVGRGACFTVLVPLAREAGGRQVPDDASPLASGDRSAVRVLAADDNATNRLVLQTLLAQIAVDLVLVEDGAAAVAAWEAQSWDLILMDMQMPVMDGLAATREIRTREGSTGRSRTPIVGLTANAMSHQKEACLAAGMDDHLAKPIDVRRLFEVVGLACGAGNV